MFNARNLNTELFGRRHRGKYTDPRVPSEYGHYARHRKHFRGHDCEGPAPEESSDSTSSSDYEFRPGHDEIEHCCPDSGLCCDTHGHRRLWKRPGFPKHKVPFWFPHPVPFHGERYGSGKCCPLLSSKYLDNLPVKVHSGCVPICSHGAAMFHIISEAKPAITITNTGSIKVEAEGVQLLNATLKENYPADKVVASYANKIVTIRIPCDAAAAEPSVEIPITIQK